MNILPHWNSKADPFTILPIFSNHKIWLFLKIKLGIKALILIASSVSLIFVLLKLLLSI